MDMTDLIVVLDHHSNNIIRRRQQFFKTRKGNQDSFDTYLTNLQYLAQTCQFVDKDSMIRDVILLGIQDEQFLNELLSKPNLSLQIIIRECSLKEIEVFNQREKLKCEKRAPEFLNTDDMKLMNYQATLDELKNCLNQTTETIKSKQWSKIHNGFTETESEQSINSRLQCAATSPETNIQENRQIQSVFGHRCASSESNWKGSSDDNKSWTIIKNSDFENVRKYRNINNGIFQGTNKGTPAYVTPAGWSPSTKTSQHSWVHLPPYGDVPPHAVHAGHDTDGDPIYVGRSNYNGDWLPAKVIPNKHTSYVCWGGQEIVTSTCEILCGTGYTWQPCYSGNVPPTAVTAGSTTSGEPLYVGRGHFNGSLTPGKIQPTHHCLYIPYGGAEHRLDNYEVLVREPSLTWMPCSGSMLPPNAIHAGHDSDGDQIYVGRAYHNGDLLPAKVIVSKGCAYVCHGGCEHVKHQYEILCGTTFRWIPSSSGHIPANSVEGGRTSNGEQLYIGRGHHCGSLTAGKIQPSHQCLYIPYGGQEIRLTNYEVLTRM